jgi:hypothetical protein
MRLHVVCSGISPVVYRHDRRYTLTPHPSPLTPNPSPLTPYRLQGHIAKTGETHLLKWLHSVSFLAALVVTGPDPRGPLHILLPANLHPAPYTQYPTPRCIPCPISIFLTFQCLHPTPDTRGIGYGSHKHGLNLAPRFVARVRGSCTQAPSTFSP